MAIGLPASYSTTVRLIVPREAAREAVRYALELLGWKFERADRDTFRARVMATGINWGECERVEISLETPGVLEITSRCSFPLQLIDWGKNRSNVDLFVKFFEAKAVRDGKLPTPDPEYFDSDGRTPTERALYE